MKRKIHTLAGEGVVSTPDGSQIGVRRYILDVWQDMISDGRGGSIPGMLSIDGRIDLQSHEALTLLGRDLTLKLNDGRSLPFFFCDTTGEIAARGALK